MFDFDVKPNFTVQNEAAISTRARRDLRYLDALAVGDTGRSRSGARHASASKLKTRP